MLIGESNNIIMVFERMYYTQNLNLKLHYCCYSTTHCVITSSISTLVGNHCNPKLEVGYILCKTIMMMLRLLCFTLLFDHLLVLIGLHQESKLASVKILLVSNSMTNKIPTTMSYVSVQ